MKVPCRRIISGIFVLFFIPVSMVQAQDLQDFLDCADFSDRIERVFCLESVLESALDEAVSGNATGPENNEVTANVATPVVIAPDSDSSIVEFGIETETETETETESRSLFRLPSIRGIFGGGSDSEDVAAEDVEVVEELEQDSSDRLESFGRPTRVVVNENGEDELVDVVADMREVKPNTLLIELASGQVWLQTHGKRFNLRKGNEVRIYPTGWGEQFRLETERLSGFIQVERVR